MRGRSSTSGFWLSPEDTIATTAVWIDSGVLTHNLTAVQPAGVVEEARCIRHRALIASIRIRTRTILMGKVDVNVPPVFIHPLDDISRFRDDINLPRG
jgi:hypothetical protein